MRRLQHKTRNRRPPFTFRFCRRCGIVRAFAYDVKVGHSRCTVCGGRFASDPLKM
jgi:transcription elongation factor Elf1